MPLYVTDDKHELGPGIPVTTQSMLKAFRQCPREAMYKYNDRLQPKAPSKPLQRGKWVHACLEAHMLGEDWRKVHKKYSHKYSLLMDEEKEKLGPLPQEIELLLRSYFWHYGDPAMSQYDWEIHEVELLVEAMMPNGHLFRGKIDGLVEDEFGLWIVDHKTHAKFPDWSYRMFDEQSTGYVWAARQMDIPVRGFIWNYLGTSGFPKYDVLKSGKAFYKKSVDAASTPLAFKAALDKAKAEYPETFMSDPDDRKAYNMRMKQLKAERWQGPDVPPLSPYFRRDYLEKSDDLIERTLKSMMRTSDTMHSYDFSDRDSVERDIKSCSGFFCNFKDLSMADLVQGDSELLKRRNYRTEDPLSYHGAEDPLK